MKFLLLLALFLSACGHERPVVPVSPAPTPTPKAKLICPAGSTEVGGACLVPPRYPPVPN
jgi:hypothetical protein